MNRALLRKSIGDGLGLLAACAALLFSFAWLYVWIAGRFEASRFERIIQPFWEKWSYMSPVPLSHLLSYPGRIALTYIAPAVMLSVALWAVARGSDAVSGWISRGTMELLLGQPLSRLQILYTQAAVTVGGLVLLAAACWAGTAAGVRTVTAELEPPPPTLRLPLLDIEVRNPFASAQPVRVPMADLVDAAVFAPAAANLFSLGFCIAGLTTLLSAMDRHRWRTVGGAAGLCVVQVAMKGFAVAAPELNWMKWFTFFAAYEPQLIVAIAVDQPERAWALTRVDASGAVVGLGPLGYDAVLLALGLLGFAAAGVIFQRRDIPAPL